MPKGRQHTAAEKLKILEEARQPGTTVAEVLRRHQLDATTFYRWERQAKDALRQAFNGTPRRDSDAKDREFERLKSELARNCRVITEVVEKNLEQKRFIAVVLQGARESALSGARMWSRWTNLGKSHHMG